MQEIIDLVAVEPAMVVVTSLIDSFNRVPSCTRRPSESILSFVTRFTGLASEHLMQTGSSPTSKAGEVLAFTMLNNANLGGTTLSSAKIQLNNAAQSRQVVVMGNYALEDQDCDNLKSIKISIDEFLQIFQTAVNEGDKLTLRSARDAVVTAKALLTSAMDLAKGVINKN